MYYTANQIADFFLSKVDVEAGDTISPLKLQKLVYYAQAWHYTIFGKTLINEPFEAWTHGPAVRSLWKRFEPARVADIDLRQLKLDVPEFDTDTAQLLNEVHEIYGEHSGSYLEMLTHNELPWIKAREGLAPYAKSTNTISLEEMKDYYGKVLSEQKKEET